MTKCFTHGVETVWRIWPAMGWYCPLCHFSLTTTTSTAIPKGTTHD